MLDEAIINAGTRSEAPERNPNRCRMPTARVRSKEATKAACSFGASWNIGVPVMLTWQGSSGHYKVSDSGLYVHYRVLLDFLIGHILAREQIPRLGGKAYWDRTNSEFQIACSWP